MIGGSAHIIRTTFTLAAKHNENAGQTITVVRAEKHRFDPRLLKSKRSD